ncbi:MAG: hypothetical protein LBL13_03395 [Bacteroidales bacterium]|jgi:hypothetical protein|nr:hypothetical protein [Bacteroidales bacterium]
MNNNNKWRWIYNPFEYVAGWKAFGIGVVLLAIATITGYFGNIVFYALEIKSVPDIPWGMAFSLQALGLGVTVGIMYSTALLFTKHTRFQDIMGTVTLAKYPLLLIALLSLVFGKEMASIDVSKIINHELDFSGYALLSAFAITAIVVLVWEIALLYNAFRVSTNLKGLKCVVLFMLAVLVSEIATLLLKSVIC